MGEEHWKAKAADFREEEDKKEHNTATTDCRWDQVGSTSEEDKKNEEEEVVWIKYNCLCSFILSFSCRKLTHKERSGFWLEIDISFFILKSIQLLNIKKKLFYQIFKISYVKSLNWSCIIQRLRIG